MDIAQSVDLYNEWFIEFAPRAYRETRVQTIRQVEVALRETANLTDITPAVLRRMPSVLPMLRMATAPPLARDRLIGLARVSPHLVRSLEINRRLPLRMSATVIDAELESIGQMILRLIDTDIFPWVETRQQPTDTEMYRAATVVADRLCGALADPIVRNAQEQRQLALLRRWLEQRGYAYITPPQASRPDQMTPGTFAFRFAIPVDAIIMPIQAKPRDFPLLVEAKSAGDYTNTNKRRKEEATKFLQLRRTYGDDVRFILLLCGYFDSGYLGYEAAEGIDWVWEHRIDDLVEFGV